MKSWCQRLVGVAFAVVLFIPLQTQAATYTVQEFGDGFGGEVCTLRNAIQSVNLGSDFGGCVDEALGSPNTINLLAGDYVLSIAYDGGMPTNEQGDLDIFANLTIQGAGSGLTTVTASGFPEGEADRVLDIGEDISGKGTEGSDLEINLIGFTIRDGFADNGGSNGGGIRIFGGDFDVRLSLDEMHVTENIADRDGGGMDAFGEIIINNSRITKNFADDDGGGLDIEGVGTITNSTIDDNRAHDVGGGIRNFSDLLIIKSTISRNQVGQEESEGPQPQGVGERGGGIYHGNGALIMINSTVSGNSAEFSGGGIHVPSEEADGSKGETVVYLFNVTVAENRVEGIAGAGGGICFGCGDVQNTGDVGVSEFSLANTLVANNQAPEGPDCGGTFTSLGYNLIGDSTGCDGFSAGTNDKQDIPAGIGALQNNGGSTETHGLNSDSPAIDMGNNSEGCQAPNIEELLDSGVFNFETLDEDQRGFPRPIAVLDPNDPICDIGAFEFQSFDFEVSKDDGLNGQVIGVGDAFTYTITVTNSGPGMATGVTLSDPLPAGVSFLSVTPSQGECSQAVAVVTCDLGDFSVGDTITVTIEVVAAAEGSLTNIVTVSSGGNQFEGSTEKQAQVTTQVAGVGDLFGGGCGISSAAPLANSAHLAWLLLPALWFGLRRRANA